MTQTSRRGLVLFVCLTSRYGSANRRLRHVMSGLGRLLVLCAVLMLVLRGSRLYWALIRFYGGF